MKERFLESLGEELWWGLHSVKMPRVAMQVHRPTASREELRVHPDKSAIFLPVACFMPLYLLYKTILGIKM